uniref:Uncharacterized protein AlNc14C54G4164 n=1 Tax=Albugo laibachii Nc14 TaxID=890382 RepID=F0WBX6_9STRA|nr:conserved hypothetical protein [Albugo laibachii Nc14]|eukprot:CCA18655.1 conserved hypothetical protein [Albugo laibachii Nc14]
MAFRREVPSLEQLVLKYISKAGKEVNDIITEETITRLHRISKPNKSRTNRVKQQLIHALLKNGRLGDDTLPTCFFHVSMTRMDLSGAKISSLLMEEFASICSKIHTVNFSGCFRLTDNAIEVLLRKCPELRDVNLENCRKLSDVSLDHLRKHATKLQCIDVGGNFNMTLPGITRFVEKHPNRSRFHKLHVSGHFLNEHALRVVMAKCKKLRSLSVGYSSLSDDAFIAFLTNRKSITRLSLHWNGAITDKLLRFMATDCPNLVELNLCGVTSVSSNALLELLRQKMKDTPAIESTRASATAEDIPPRPKKMKMIDFRYTRFKVPWSFSALTYSNRFWCSVSKEAVAFVHESYPDLQIVY